MDEAQTLDAIFRKDESAVEEMSDTLSQRLTETYIHFVPPAATEELEKAGKGLMAHKCAEHLLFPYLSD
jgi:hypothetical protein